MSIQMKCPFKYCLLLYWVGLGWIVWLGWVELSDCLIGLGWSACIALSDSTILAIFGLDGSIGLGWRLRVVRWLLILAGYLCSGGAVEWVWCLSSCSCFSCIFWSFSLTLLYPWCSLLFFSSTWVEWMGRYRLGWVGYLYCPSQPPPSINCPSQPQVPTALLNRPRYLYCPSQPAQLQILSGLGSLDINIALVNRPRY